MRATQAPALLPAAARSLLALRGGLEGASAPLTAASQPEDNAAPAALVASLMGYAIFAGSLLLYSPIILQIVRSRSGTGLSMSSWAMSLIGFGGALVYQAACGYPIHTYAELIALTAQTVAILGLLLHYDHHVDGLVLGAGLGAFGTALYALSRAPKLILTSLQAISAVLVTVSLLPQIVLPFRTGTCGWSSVSAALSTAGTAARVFTTWQVTQDMLVLAGYVCGCLLNIVLLTQTLVYPNPSRVA